MDLAVYAAVFCALGLRLLFGGYSVGLGTVILLGAVSAAGTVAIESFWFGKEPPRLEDIPAAPLEDARGAWETAKGLAWALFSR